MSSKRTSVGNLLLHPPYASVVWGLGKNEGQRSITTTSVPPVEMLEENDDMETNLHTVYTAPDTPEQGTDPIISRFITPPPLEDDQNYDVTLAGRERSETITELVVVLGWSRVSTRWRLVVALQFSDLIKSRVERSSALASPCGSAANQT